jgi:tetratricopeptide (TPR) repeat protein
VRDERAHRPGDCPEGDGGYSSGRSLYYAGDLDAAESSLATASAAHPRDVDALYLLARAKWKKGDLKGALSAFQALLSLKPNYASALADLALLLLEGLNNAGAAERFARRAIDADPLCARAFLILGNAQHAGGETESALASYHDALALDPRLPDAMVNLGVIAHEKGDFDSALLLYDRALRVSPSHPNAHWNRGNALLTLGRLEEGWSEYEYRFLITGANASVRDPDRVTSSWDGSPFTGKRLLVYSEQGLGDTMQFARYLPLVRERGGSVILECRSELARLLSGFPGLDEIAVEDTPPGRTVYDLAVPLLSLPRIFSTCESSIPSAVPYISADAGSAARYRPRIDERVYNVGVVWGGNPAHRNDAARSMDRKYLLALSSLPGVQMYSLQKHEASLDPVPPAGVIDLGGELDDLSVTSGVIANLDLVLTVDTAVAHLAGAMGKPVWVLLPFVPDWRWQLDREDSPWYPTMRLFRQSAPGDWWEVMDRVASCLASESAKKSAGVSLPDLRTAGPAEALALFEQGSGYFASGDVEGALRCFRGAVAADGAHAESRNALGVVLSALGESHPAAAEIAAAIALEPDNARYHYNLGNVFKEEGHRDQAAACYNAAIAIDPEFLQAHVNLGILCNERGDPASALEEYRSALALNPTSHDLLKNVALLCQSLHDEQGALQAFERAIVADPCDAESYHRAGILRQSRGDVDDAVRYYRKAVDLKPEMAEAWASLGTALVLKKLPEEAYRALETALRIKPDFPEVLNNMGMVLKERGQSTIAEKCFRMAIRSNPDYSPAHNNLGSLFLENSRFADAAEEFRLAVSLTPEYHLAWNNLGNALAGLGKFHQAKQIYRAVIAEDPSIPEVHFNLAAALQHEHRFDESIRSYEDALRCRPGYAEARLNRALVLLLRGEFEEGWRDYECRFSVRDPRRIYVPPGPENLRWDGSDIAGKRILVRPEQGFGDTIQFARYLPILASRGASVLFECPKELCALFRGFPGIDELIEFRPDPPPLPFDRYVQLLSLPGLLGTHSVESIPWSGPYVQADPVTVESLRGRFADGLFHVGIVWGGNPLHKNDYNRSCALEEFLPLLDVGGVRFFSLQKGNPVADLAGLPAAKRIENLEPLLSDFSMTAVLLSHIDLLISVDTSVAHLAGAMGRPVWTLLPYRPDWRWLLERTDSPWYPSMKLFRQSTHAGWPSVIRDIRAELVKTAGV